MSEPFIGEIRMFAGTFAPRGWALCDGQLLPLSSNDSLFSLLGTIYGGDGRTTFGLPDLRGRLPMHQGSGPGLTPRRLGAKGGNENVTLTTNQLPSHTHTMQAINAQAHEKSPVGKMTGIPTNNQANGAEVSAYSPTKNAQMASNALSYTGGGQSHVNLMPSLCVHFIIALVGIYPSRS